MGFPESRQAEVTVGNNANKLSCLQVIDDRQNSYIELSQHAYSVHYASRANATDWMVCHDFADSHESTSLPAAFSRPDFLLLLCGGELQ